MVNIGKDVEEMNKFKTLLLLYNNTSYITIIEDMIMDNRIHNKLIVYLRISLILFVRGIKYYYVYT